MFGRWRSAWLVTGLLVAVAVIVGACQFMGKSPQDNVRTVPVMLGDLQKTVTAVGALKPKDYVDVGTQVSGRVEKVHVDIGQRVKKGELIAEIDATVYESTVRKDRAELENLKAQLRQQQAELALAQQKLTRNRAMRPSDAVSQTTVDESEAEANVAEATVESIRAQIKAADATLEGDLANLGYTKVYAPIDGTVVSQTTLEGQTVNAVQSAPIIVQVANLDVMTVWAQVAEADVGRIKSGAPAYFTTLGSPDQQWRGVVRMVQPTPETENDVVLYNVLIDVENKGGVLLPSMTVQVFFVLGEAQGVPLAPLNALQPNRAAGSNMYRARVMTKSGPVDREVEVGITNRSTAQIVAGLQPGEQLILSQQPPGGMPPGMPGGGPPPGMGPRL